MKSTNPGKVSLLLSVAILTIAIAVPAFAKDKALKYSVSQIGATPQFTVTSHTKRSKTVDFEFDLVDAQGRTEYSYVQNDQTMKPNTSQTYNMGPLMLTPAGSPYHVSFTVTSANKKHKVIETLLSVGTFTVVH